MCRATLERLGTLRTPTLPSLVPCPSVALRGLELGLAKRFCKAIAIALIACKMLNVNEYLNMQIQTYMHTHIHAHI